jgi:hypothetical protein
MEKNYRTLGGLIAFVIIVVSLYSLYIIANNNQKNITDGQYETNASIGPILASTDIKQSFVSHIEIIDKFSLLMATYARINTCSVSVSLSDNSGKEWQRWDFNAQDIQDNKTKEFVLDKPVNDAANKRFWIKVSSDSRDPDDAITLWFRNGGKYPNGDLLIGESTIDGSLYFQVSGHNVPNSRQSIYKILIVSCIVILSSLLIYVLKLKFDGDLFDTLIVHRYLIFSFLFLLLVILQIHGFSLNMWDIVFGAASEGRDNLIFGSVRDITSDSWGITVLQFFSQCEAGFPLYNRQISSEGANALLYGLPVWDITILGRPSLWGFLLLGKGMGLAWFFCFRLFALLLCSYETISFLTGKNKSVSALGAILIAFSPMAQWWGTHLLPEIILYGEMLFTAGYYYCENAGCLWKKILFALLVLISLVGFIILLYPAIAVPFGIVVLLMAASYLWMVRNKIKLSRYDFIIIGTTALLVAIIVIRFVYISIDDLRLLTNTVSPGKRFEYGGAFNIDILFLSYFQWLLPFNNVPVYNNCEVSGIIPLTTIILIAFPFVMDKDKQHRFLNISLYSFFVFCISWLLFVFPYTFAKFTLFYNVTGNRLVWTIGALSIYLVCIMANFLSKNEAISLKSTLAIMFGVLLIFLLSYQKSGVIAFIEKSKRLYLLIAVTFLLLLVYSFLRWKKYVFIGLCLCFTIISGFTVLPVNTGFSNLYEYDFSKRIYGLKSANPEAIWLVNGYFPLGNYIASYGVNSFNATNLYPDYSKWKKIDVNGGFENIYNRYAQVSATVDASMTDYQLLGADHIFVTLSLSDIKKIGVNYVFSRSELHYDGLNLVYENDGYSVWIYKVNY